MRAVASEVFSPKLLRGSVDSAPALAHGRSSQGCRQGHSRLTDAVKSLLFGIAFPLPKLVNL